LPVNAGADPNQRRFLDAALGRDLIGGVELYATDVAGQAVRIFADHPHRVVAVGLVDPHGRDVPTPLACRSSQTLRQHRDNIWALGGGEVISQLQMDSGLRRRPIKQVVLDLAGDDGGPLLSHGQSDVEQHSFDATCRKLTRFLNAREISCGHNSRSSVAATNRPRRRLPSFVASLREIGVSTGGQ
jgi:hypothetical protein